MVCFLCYTDSMQRTTSGILYRSVVYVVLCGNSPTVCSGMMCCCVATVEQRAVVFPPLLYTVLSTHSRLLSASDPALRWLRIQSWRYYWWLHQPHSICDLGLSKSLLNQNGTAELMPVSTLATAYQRSNVRSTGAYSHFNTNRHLRLCIAPSIPPSIPVIT